MKHYYRHPQHLVPHALRHRHPKDYYLLVYNSATYFMWAYLMVLVLIHLSSPVPKPTILNPVPAPQPGTASQQLLGSLKSLFFPSRTTPPVSPTPKPNTFQKSSEYLFSSLHTLQSRAQTTYSSRGIGLYTLVIQSLAFLEVLHSILGWTRSPLTTTVMQVSSRLFVVWWFVESSLAAQFSSFYASMLIAWCLAEMLRSTYYVFSLLRLVPPQAHTSKTLRTYVTILTWLRYTAFYILYPLGAGSEYMLLLKGFPAFPSYAQGLAELGAWTALTGLDAPAWKVWAERVKLFVYSFGLGSWARVPLVVIWPASK